MILPPPRPVFFSYPKKQKKNREKFQISAREDLKLPEKKSCKLPEKKELCPRKKKRKFLPEKKKSLPEKKIRNQAVRNQKKSFKILNFCPRKNLKSIQDNFKMPEKIYAKVVEKNSFHPRKKSKKGQQIGFSGTFHFLG